jgi:hypothetical protein
MANLVGEERNETLIYILETPAEIARQKKVCSNDVQCAETVCTSEEHRVFHWSVILGSILLVSAAPTGRLADFYALISA